MKVLLIDDHPLILSALQAVIGGLERAVELHCAETAQAARQRLLGDAEFDLVLLDLRLGDADGFELLAELREAYPALPLVVLSASDHSVDIFRAIDLGAMGFVPKRASNQMLLEALRMVMSGGIYVPPLELRSRSRARPFGMADASADALGSPADPGPPSLASLHLTRRQTDVLGLLLRGQSNKLIARALNLSVETIKDHVAAVLRALKVNTRTQAVLVVSQMASGGAVLPRATSPERVLDS